MWMMDKLSTGLNSLRGLGFGFQQRKRMKLDLKVELMEHELNYCDKANIPYLDYLILKTNSTVALYELSTEKIQQLELDYRLLISQLRNPAHLGKPLHCLVADPSLHDYIIAIGAHKEMAEAQTEALRKEFSPTRG